MKTYLKWFKIFFVIATFFTGIIFGLFWYYSNELPPLSELHQYDLKTSSKLFDRNDKLIHTFEAEKRELTNINTLPTYLIYGQTAVEDKNFFNHWGVDIYGIFRAIARDIKTGSFAQGASTITQQISRNLFLSLDKTLPRKLKEVLLAIRIEKNFSKLEILELYFNKVPYGPGIYGIEAASQKYFGKKAKDLTITEAALIIGMPQLPSAYYPFRYPERALKRRSHVLKRMLTENIITKAQYDASIKAPLGLIEKKQKVTAGDYFIEHVRQKVEKKYGTQKLLAGGLNIYTTIDFDLTIYADSIINKKLTEFETKQDYEFKYHDFPADTTDFITPYLQGGACLIEAETGYVRMLIGGRNFSHSKFNRMIHSRRQPGSSFKPILYSAALESGYTPATVIQDQPLTFLQNDSLFWSPHNYGRKYYGFTRMRDALKRSQNIYAVKMIYDITPKKTVKYAKRYGLNTKIYPYYSLAIGTCEVKPIEMISAYTTFANGGYRTNPIFIRKITDKNGQLLEQAETEKIDVINPKTAYLMQSLMKSVIDEGTGRSVRWRGYRYNGAAKTGTTDDYRDAWFIGYNNELVCGIWTGFDDNHTMGKFATGATAALPPWAPIMIKAMKLDADKNASGKPVIDGNRYEFTKPKGIVTTPISARTGLLPENEFEEILIEEFIAGTEPTPLSDSLAYNFYPTKYRFNERDSLVIDLGGEKNEAKRDSINLSGAKIIDHYFKKVYNWEPKPDSTLVDSINTEINGKDINDLLPIN